MVVAIKNANLVLENGIVWDGAIIIENGILKNFGKESEINIPADANVIDAEGAYVGPGFVDIHVHGGNEFQTYDNPKEAAEFFLSHGETSILATPVYSQNFDEIMNSIGLIKEAMKTSKTIKGIYFEGPFTNPDYGACSDINPWRRDITDKEIKAMVDAAGEDAKVWTIAPERNDVKALVKYAREVNPNTVFALGHSEATPDMVRALGVKYRPTLETHCTNATGRVNSKGGIRGVGIDEYCLKDPDVYAELISDSFAVHVYPDMQQLIIHNKGINKVVLITDSTVSEYPNPERLAYVKDLNFDHNGRLNGSRLTLDLACKNIMASTNCGIAQAFLMASTNPAKVIGMYDDIGSIDYGKVADLVFVDDKFNVKKVLLGGEEVK